MSVRSSGEEKQEWVHTFCDMCTCGCGIKVLKINGVPVKIEGDSDNPHNRGKLCAKGQSGLLRLYNPARVKKPLRRTNPQKGVGIDPGWEEISWNEALDLVVNKLSAIRNDDPRKLIVMSWDEVMDKALLTSWTQAFGTMNRCAGPAGYFCGNGVHPVNYLTCGTWYVDPDLEYCNYYLMIGSQLGFIIGYNTMPITASMAEARKRGMKLVVVDPLCTTAAAKADEWIPIRPGTDGAFALGLLNVMINELDNYDAEFLKLYTNAPYLVGDDGMYVRDSSSGKPLVYDTESDAPKPYDDVSVKDPSLEGSFEVNGIHCSPSFSILRRHVKKYTPEYVSTITTVKPGTIRRIATEFAKASRIGEKIVIDGKELPHRPVATYYDRGTSGHKHGFLSCWSIMLLNIVTGNLDAVGGVVSPNGAGPWWTPKAGPDGLLIPSEVSEMYNHQPYPPRHARKPESLDLVELFPVCVYSETPMLIVSQKPEQFHIPYKPEMLLHWRTNFVHTTADINVVTNFVRSIPMMVSFASQIDETVMMADIVLPASTYLERIPYPKSTNFYRNRPDLSSYYWLFMQQVVEPAYEAREVGLVLLEIAEKVGFIHEFYSVFNKFLKEPYKLDQDKPYDWNEICDRWIKSYAGENGPEEAKRKGFIDFGRRRAEHAYWRRFHNIRIPLYLEFVPTAGHEVEKIVSELGIHWDTSDYQAVPDWKPCPSYSENRDGFDLFAVNTKSVLQMVSHTDDVAWLSKLSEKKAFGYNLLINKYTAEQRGLGDGDHVNLQAPNGQIAKGTVKFSDGVHPEVVGIAGDSGHWSSGMPAAKGKGTHYNSLLTFDLDHIDMVDGALDQCVKVKISKVPET